MENYDMLYEDIILSAWDNALRRGDPFKLGDADILRNVDNNLSSQNGHDAKFALSTALRKIAAENSNNGFHTILMDLDNQIWEAKELSDICIILEKTKQTFNQLKINLINH